MNTILFFCCLLFGKTWGNVSIVGGSKVKDRSEFPFQVSIRVNEKHQCGGSILDKYHIVTAAHCCFYSPGELYDPSELTIVTGNLKLSEDGPIQKTVTNFTVHENFNTSSLDNDIAILRISEPFLSWSKNISPIEVTTVQPPHPGTVCNISGWGSIKSWNENSDDLLYAEIPIQSKDDCKKQEDYANYLTDNMFCAGIEGVDACKGDSGGPLICNKKLTGIVSWGYSCGKYYGVYTNLVNFKHWIAKQMDNGIAKLASNYLLLLFFIILIEIN